MYNLVPRFILENFAAQRFGGRFYAVSLFADVSGFTTVTEALAQHGKEGSEALADVMSALFTPLVRSVYEQGGFITVFAGDGFTAVFPIAQPHSHRRALAAARAMGQYLAVHPCHTTPLGEFDFQLKVGLAEGEVEWGILQAEEGIPHIRHGTSRAYYFGGEAIDVCARAEKLARGGDVVLSSWVATALQDAVIVEPVDNFFRLVEVAGELPPPQKLAPPDDAGLSEAACAFLPAELGQLSTRGEYRNTLAVFLSLQGIQAREQLAAFMQPVFHLLRQYGGFLSHIEFGDKGCAILLFWGAPVSYENDVERALNFLLDLKATAPSPFRAGITYRVTYAGLVGSDLRADYVCYAQGANLAARMMTAAGWGELWLDEDTAWLASVPPRRGTPSFLVELLERHAFKGLDEGQIVYTLRGQRAPVAPFYEGDLAGRQDEIEQLTEAVQPIFDGRFAGVTTVCGEAGIGKSRLLYEVWRRCRMASGPLARFLCQADQTLRQSLNPFRYFLRRYFGQSSPHGMDDLQRKERFTMRLEALVAQTPDLTLQDELERTRSFLGALVDLRWPGSLYEQLAPKLRFENVMHALETLFKAESQHRPVILQIEDLQWLDADSVRFLQHLTHRLDGYPLVILASSRRPPDVGLFDPHVSQQTIDLGPLSRPELQVMAARLLGGPVAPSLLDLLVERTDGNPFFVEQLLRYLQNEGLVLEEDDGFSSVGTERLIPAKVRAVLSAHLDRLPPDIREVVQTAAVLGREFELPVLAEMLDYVDLTPKVEVVTRADIWSPLGQGRCQFHHALMHDVAYDMQLQSRRRQLHQLAGEAITRVHAADLPAYYADLAYHYDQAGAGRRAARLYRLVGERAAAQFANAESVDYLSRSLELIPEERDERRYALLLAREQVYHLQGKRSLQCRDLLALQALAERQGDKRQQAEVQLRQAEYAVAISDYPAAAEHYKTVLALARAIDDAGMESAAHCGLGRIAHLQGTWDTAVHHLETGLALARKHDDQPSMALALMTLADVARQRRDTDQAVDLAAQSMALYRKLDDRPGIARALNSLGLVADLEGKREEAERYYSESLNLSKEIGDRRSVAIGLNNLGYLAYLQGNHEKAKRYLKDALLISKDIGFRGLRANALVTLGIVCVSRGEGKDAWQNLHEGLREAVAIGVLYTIVYVVVGVAWLQMQAGQYERAAELLGLALSHQALECDVRRDTAEPLLKALCEYLPSEQLALQVARGGGLDLDTVVAEIVGGGVYGSSSGVDASSACEAI